MYDVIIIGAGPAGVSCSIWLKQLGFSILLIEKNEKAGGLQLQNPYSNTWIATNSNVNGEDIVKELNKNLEIHKINTLFNVEVKNAKVDKNIKIIIEDKIIESKYLVLATGTTPKKNNLIKRAGLILGPSKELVSTNFKNKKIAILGGGDSAFENYIKIKEKQPQNITIFARTIKARIELIKQVDINDVIVGDYNFNDQKSEVNEQHYDEIIMLYGYEANKESLLSLDLSINKNGYIMVNENCETSNDLIYAIGEINGKNHPCCVTSMADGVIAAKNIQYKLEKNIKDKYISLFKRAINIGGNLK